MSFTVTVLDDYQGCCAFLDAAHTLDGSDIRLDVEHNHLEAASLPARLADSDAVILIRERTTLTREILAQLPKLRLIVQTVDCPRQSISRRATIWGSLSATAAARPRRRRS